MNRRPSPHPDGLPAAWHGLLSRRDLLRAGSLGVASTFLPGKVQAAKHAPGKAKSVILLWMGGGVTHIDSFDPKPDAPVEIRGSLTSIQTALTGVRFGEVMPDLARAAKKLAGMSAGWLSGRRSLREQLDAGLRGLEQSGLATTMRRQYQGAFDMLLAPSVRKAFDLRLEPHALRERYGSTKIGQRCLLARRL